MSDQPAADWSHEDRAAARAFLQRCEVRLSTLHRVATALLSGAGLMVLLPAMLKDQIVGVASTLLAARPSFAHVLLSVVALVVLALPLVVLFLLLGDLTRFYFHAEHLATSEGTAFAPRFTLSGLQMPADEVSTAAASTLERARRSSTALDVLVPKSRRGLDRLDQRLRAYRKSDGEQPDDAARASALFDLVGARPRTMAEEVAKVEYGLTRHLLRLQTIVMRYVKALLAFLVTALAVFGAAAIVNHDQAIGASTQVWLAALFAVWAPTMMAAVASPVRWVDQLLRVEGASVGSVAADREFTRFERLALVVGATVLALATAALIASIVEGVAMSAELGAIAVICGAIAAFAIAANRSIARPSLSRPAFRQG